MTRFACRMAPRVKQSFFRLCKIFKYFYNDEIFQSGISFFIIKLLINKLKQFCTDNISYPVLPQSFFCVFGKLTPDYVWELHSFFFEILEIFPSAGFLKIGKFSYQIRNDSFLRIIIHA